MERSRDEASSETKFPLMAPQANAWALRLLTISLLLFVGVLAADIPVPLRFLFVYWSIVLLWSLLGWWRPYVAIRSDCLTGRGITSFRLPLSDIAAVNEQPLAARRSSSQIGPVKAYSDMMMRLSARFSRAAGTNVLIKTRDPKWRLLTFPIPWLVRRDTLELALKGPAAFVAAIQARLDRSHDGSET